LQTSQNNMDFIPTLNHGICHACGVTKLCPRVCRMLGFFVVVPIGILTCSQVPYVCFQHVLKFSWTNYSNSQCVPRHVPNSVSLYSISLALCSTLVTYIKRPNGGDYPTSILKLSKTWLPFFFWCDGQSMMLIWKEEKKKIFGGSPQLINMRHTMLWSHTIYAPTISPGQKWGQTVLEIKTFMQPMRRLSMQSWGGPVFFFFVWGRGEGFFFWGFLASFQMCSHRVFLSSSQSVPKLFLKRIPIALPQIYPIWFCPLSCVYKVKTCGRRGSSFVSFLQLGSKEVLLLGSAQCS
jgi:hypothetical protein